jgi:ABC-type multidrug transport system fused ATPase/permease subunit
MIYRSLKALSLCIPLILSIILLVGVFVLAFEVNASSGCTCYYHLADGQVVMITDAKSEYETAVRQIESKTNILLAIVGIAVTVWIGINVYNAVERYQVDKLEEKTGSLNAKLAEFEEKMNNMSTKLTEFEVKIRELEEKRPYVDGNTLVFP